MDNGKTPSDAPEHGTVVLPLRRQFARLKAALHATNGKFLREDAYANGTPIRYWRGWRHGWATEPVFQNNPLGLTPR